LNYKLCKEWQEKRLPVVIGTRTNGTRLEQVSIDSIDFDLQTTLKVDVPDYIVQESLQRMEDPFLLLKSIGGRRLKHKEKYNRERVGLCMSSIAQGFSRSGLFKHTC